MSFRAPTIAEQRAALGKALKERKIMTEDFSKLLWEVNDIICLVLAQLYSIRVVCLCV